MKFLRILVLKAGAITLLALVGCQSTEMRQEQVSQREDIHQLQEKIGGLQSDVRSVREENDALKEEVSRLKEDLMDSRESNTQYQKDIERLDGLVKKLDTAREQDRKIIVEEVSNEISRLSKKISRPPPPDKEKISKSKVEEGVEHVVAKGDTLTAIAKAYGVSKKALMEANDLTKPDLKIGQKLFIPKK